MHTLALPSCHSIESAESTYLPPTDRRMGFPVRVMAMSEIARRCIALVASLWVDRIAVGNEAILACMGCKRSSCPDQLALSRRYRCCRA